jgi:hypothetical protein
MNEDCQWGDSLKDGTTLPRFIQRFTHMRIVCLAVLAMLASMAISGCGENTKSKPTEPFELDGKWLFLGPWDGEHTIKIDDASMEYDDISGTWSSTWDLKSYDNELHHFQIAFTSGTGTYFPEGQNFSGTYVLSDPILTIQLASGTDSYMTVESPGSCTKGDEERIPDCRLYVKQN